MVVLLLLVRSLATVQIPLLFCVVGVSMPLELFSVLLPLPGLLLPQKLQTDVLRIVDVSCVRHKMNTPRRSRRLDKPSQQSQLQQYPALFLVQQRPGLQRFSVGSRMLGLHLMHH